VDEEVEPGETAAAAATNSTSDTRRRVKTQIIKTIY